MSFGFSGRVVGLISIGLSGNGVGRMVGPKGSLLNVMEPP
jgi:hypothetical protein